jgi:hypothetical protein
MILRLRTVSKLIQMMVVIKNSKTKLKKMFAALALCCWRMIILSTLCR